MDLIYKFSSTQYADMLGISTEALRSRRRREIFRNWKKDEFGNYWWKDDRPNKNAVNENNRLVRGPRTPSHAPRKRNRGSMANGTAKEFPNYKMEINNEVKIMSRIRKSKYGDLTGDEIADEIGPEMIDLAVKNIRKRKADLSEESFKKATGDNTYFNPPGDKTPQEYGKLLNGDKYISEIDKIHAASLRKYNLSTDTKFFEKTKTTPFGGTYKVNRIDFTETSRTNRPPPYYVGTWVDPDSVEVSHSQINSISDDREPKFKNKIAESIWRLKNNK